MRKVLKNIFKGKGIFVFSDPGGAKAILSMYLKLKSSLDLAVLISDREYSFYSDFNIKVNIHNENYKETIIKFNPDFILTSTSYTSKIELEYINFAKTIKCKTLSFIDHWTSLRDRFFYNDKYVFPDHILVIDKEAKEKAFKEGIIKSKIYIFGNPYYDFLKKWNPNISKEDFLSQININYYTEDLKIIVFAPDPLSNVSGKDNFGFDEIEAIEMISLLLDKSPLNALFLIKPHPNQKIDIFNKINIKNTHILDKNVNSNLLIYYSDIIIGFFSNFLIEAHIMNKTIIRFFPKKIINDPFHNKNFGKIVIGENLIYEIKKILND